MSGLRLRQPVVATRHRDKVVTALQSLFGLGISHTVEDAPSHAEFGLRAAHLPVGEQFIEVIEPLRDDVPAGRHLARLGGDGGYMVILQVPSAEEAAKRVRAQGARIIWEGGDAVYAVHLHPKDTGGTLLSLAQDMKGDSWGQAGENWRAHVRTDHVHHIERADIACEDPVASAVLWSALLGVERSGSDGFALQLDEGSLRFVPAIGQPHGPSGLTLARTPGSPIELGTALKIGNLDISVTPGSDR